MSDAEKAKRYRIKLGDLMNASHSFLTHFRVFGVADLTIESAKRLENEINTIRQQLEIEKQFEAKTI